MQTTKVVLVTGTPGVGKTTVAHKLASKLDAEYVDITELVKKNKLYISLDEKRQTLIADIEKVTKQLQKILDTSGGTIIIEGHYAADVVPKTYVNTAFVLRRDPRELKTVLETRGYDEKKVWENLSAEILDVCLYDALSVLGAGKVCEIDVTGNTVDAVLEECIAVLEKKKVCMQGIVDWLGKLENDGQLDKFLENMG